MNNQNKYNCYFIDHINIETDSPPLGGYNDWTAPLYVAILAHDSHSS